MRRALIALAAAGCGDSAGGEVVPDAAAAPRFGALEHLAELASPSDDLGVTFAAGASLVVIDSDRVGNYKLWSAERTPSAAAFGPVTPILVTDMAGGEEVDPELSQDGLEMHYYSTVNWPGVRRVTRAALDAPWSAPDTLDLLREREGPSLAVDDLRMVVSIAAFNDEPGGGIEEYARAGRDEPWQLIRAHAALGATKWPAISADGLEIFVIDAPKDRRAVLEWAVRGSLDEPFGAPQPVELPGVDGDVGDPELAEDGKSLYLAARRDGYFDIYRTVR